MGYDILVMDHLHAPEYLRGDGLIDYVNTGDWKGSNTYVEIEDSTVRLMNFSI